MTKLLKTGMPFFELFQNTLTFKENKNIFGLYYVNCLHPGIYVMGLVVAQSKFYVWKKKILELLKKMNFANILYIILFINVALACKSAPPKEEVATTTTTTGKSFQETWTLTSN